MDMPARNCLGLSLKTSGLGLEIPPHSDWVAETRVLAENKSARRPVVTTTSAVTWLHCRPVLRWLDGQSQSGVEGSPESTSPHRGQ